jgi:4-amino-4-deoxy-L-arabinose transferase-like glycosyltransferase
MPPATAPQTRIPKRPLANTLFLLTLWTVFYASFTLYAPALLDDADSVHAEVAREMLLRHDWVTLYANGIRYLEKAPLLYWSMAASFKLFGVSAAAARIPLALVVLALAFAVETFARRAFRNAKAGLYAALILLSSPGFFLFTRISIPDAMLCLWLTLALLCFWLSEECVDGDSQKLKLLCYAFAACCALGVLTKGLIGVVFPVAIVLIYLPLTRGGRATITRIRQLHPLSSLAVFLAIAAPWHILIALANPTQGHPGGLAFSHAHFAVPLPTDGNVHGWLWFYFVNEQLLRYLNLRVPRDYDTVPLWLFWGLCLVWLMPWSAFLFNALAQAIRYSMTQLSRDRTSPKGATPYQPGTSPQGNEEDRMTRAEGPAYLLLALWAAFPLLFFSLSTRQEYYVLPALPALAILIAGWLAQEVDWQPITDRAKKIRRADLRATSVLLALGAIFAAAALIFLLLTRAPAPDADLAQLLAQNPADYALSMGHFLDLNAAALALFRLPLMLAAAALFLGPLCSLLLRKKNLPHAATLALAPGAFGFLLAAHLGLQTFAPVLSSAQLARTIAPQVQPQDLIVIHQEYEFASTLGFYLHRPSYAQQNGQPVAVNPIHILTDAEYNGVADYGRSSNLWYGSFFRDAPAIFETPHSLAEKWPGPQRIFLWQDLGNQPSQLPALPGPVYVIASSGGKEIVSNKQNQP